jgi:hypothetical protein
MTEARPPPSSMASAYWSQGKNNSLWQTSSSAYSRCRLLSLPQTLGLLDLLSCFLIRPDLWAITFWSILAKRIR